MSKIYEETEPPTEDPMTTRQRWYFRLLIWITTTLRIDTVFNAYADSLIINRLEGEVNRLVEQSALSARIWEFQNNMETSNETIAEMELFVRRNMKGFRAEMSNLAVLTAKQRDEIGELSGRQNAQREMVRAFNTDLQAITTNLRESMAGAALHFETEIRALQVQAKSTMDGLWLVTQRLDPDRNAIHEALSAHDKRLLAIEALVDDKQDVM